MAKSRLITEALVMALKRESRTADGRMTRNLQRIADRLVALAIDGDMQAIREILDRTEGKVPTAVSGADGGPLTISWLPAGVEATSIDVTPVNSTLISRGD